jgi:hypothetical protein
VIAFERLAMLALRELPEHEALEVEEHVLGCDGCAAILEGILDLGDRIAEVTRSGGAFLLAGPTLVERLVRDRMVTRTYRASPGGQVHCTVDAGDVYTAMHLALDTRGLRRIDLLYGAASGGYRIDDVPFDPDGGEVVFVQPAEYLRTLPTERKTIRLIAVDDAGERVVGEYVLNHTAYRPVG